MAPRGNQPHKPFTLGAKYILARNVAHSLSGESTAILLRPEQLRYLMESEIVIASPRVLAAPSEDRLRAAIQESHTPIVWIAASPRLLAMTVDETHKAIALLPRAFSRLRAYSVKT